MTRWVLGGTVCAGIGAAAFVLSRPQSESPVVAPEPPVIQVASQTQPLASPECLPAVVEVLDLDPLLDPPARPTEGVPFDVDARGATAGIAASTTSEVARPIPPANDDTDQE